MTTAFFASRLRRTRSITPATTARGLDSISATTPDGQTIGYSQDSSGRLSSVRAPDTTTQWHLTLRLPVLITEPTRGTAYSYDTAGSKLTETITDSVSGRTATWAWSYTPQGQVATTTDPNNRVTIYRYCSDTVFSGVDPNAVGHTTGDLQCITTAAGHVTSFTSYDKAGRVLQSIDAKGITTDTRYSYDAAHRLISIKDAKGNEVNYTLDNACNRSAEQIKDPSGVLQRSISRSFDALNRLQQVSGAAQ